MKTQQHIPLDQEQRTHLGTSETAYHLNRSPQTLRVWACYETYPPSLKPIRVTSKLAWPVAGIKQILGVTP